MNVDPQKQNTVQAPPQAFSQTALQNASSKPAKAPKTKPPVGFEEKITRWVGSRSSLYTHTVLFIAAFAAILLGVSADRVLLVLTTIVSLEAIYLSIFIQMSVNRNTLSLAEVEDDIDEIQEDVEEITEDIEEIQEEVDEISEDIEEIQEDIHEEIEAKKRI